MKLQSYSVQRCETSSGWLVHNNKILLVFHKMLQIWLAPGGHVDENELPHQAAEREFYEETGVKVRTISAFPQRINTVNTEELPMPFGSNLHWINKPGEVPKKRSDGSICSQHYVWRYFVEPIFDADDKKHEIRIGSSDEGIEDIRWYSVEELDDLQTSEDIRNEARYALQHYPKK